MATTNIDLTSMTGCTAEGCPIRIAPPSPTIPPTAAASTITPTSITNPNANTTALFSPTVGGAPAALATTLVQYQGFGSFHSENIEELVRLPEDRYRKPERFPTWALTYPADQELVYLEAFTDVLEAQDTTVPALLQEAARGVETLALGLPTRRIRDVSLANEKAEHERNELHERENRKASAAATTTAQQHQQRQQAAATAAAASSSASNNNHHDIVFGNPVSQRHFITDTDAWCFVNHGAFGGALRGGTLIKRRFEDVMEQQPLQFVDRAVLPNIVYCLRQLAKFFNCRPQDIVPASNATLALNAAINACVRHHTDVVAYLDLEYGSVWKMLREQWNWTRCTMHEIVMYPHMTDGNIMKDDQKFTDLLESKLPEHLDVFVVDHVTSNSAMLLPVFSHIIPMLRRRGVRNIVVDGAHGALQFPLDFNSLREDQLPTYYAGNLHKWLSTPKSAGFLWVHPSMQARTHSPIITHGARAGMLSEFAWEGTKEYGAFLTIPAVLDFWQRRCGVERVREYCSTLLAEADTLLCSAFGTKSVPRGAPFMRLVPLPTFFHRKIFSAKFVQDTLHNVYRVEVPVKDLEGSLYMRVSSFIYNTRADYEKLRDSVLCMRASLRNMFANFCVKRNAIQEQQHSKNNNNNNNNNNEVDLDPIALLQALADLLEATNNAGMAINNSSLQHPFALPPSIIMQREQEQEQQQQQSKQGPFAKPPQSQMDDASPLPYIDHVLAAFEMLERIQADHERQEQPQNNNNGHHSDDKTNNGENNNHNSNHNHNDDDGGEEPHPMKKNGCAEGGRMMVSTSSPTRAAAIGGTAPDRILDSAKEDFGGALRADASGNNNGIGAIPRVSSGFPRIASEMLVGDGSSPQGHNSGNGGGGGGTPMRNDSRAAQLVKALVAKKPCPDSTTKGGCGVYGINTMKTTAFTDSSSDSDD